MAFSQTCGACMVGNHTGHIQTVPTPFQLIDGNFCGCTGECAVEAKKTKEFFKDLVRHDIRESDVINDHISGFLDEQRIQYEKTITQVIEAAAQLDMGVEVHIKPMTIFSRFDDAINRTYVADQRYEFKPSKDVSSPKSTTQTKHGL